MYPCPKDLPIGVLPRLMRQRQRTLYKGIFGAKAARERPSGCEGPRPQRHSSLPLIGFGSGLTRAHIWQFRDVARFLR